MRKDIPSILNFYFTTVNTKFTEEKPEIQMHHSVQKPFSFFPLHSVLSVSSVVIFPI